MDTIAETRTSPWLSKLNETQVQRTSWDGEFRPALGQKWSPSSCAHDDVHIFHPILLFESFILPADIINQLLITRS